MPLSLGILDSRWPGNIRTLASIAERYGYTRYWVTEHHSAGQSGSPIIAATAALGATSRIRVGTAGVMLRYYRTARLVKDFQDMTDACLPDL